MLDLAICILCLLLKGYLLAQVQQQSLVIHITVDVLNILWVRWLLQKISFALSKKVFLVIYIKSEYCTCEYQTKVCLLFTATKFCQCSYLTNCKCSDNTSQRLVQVTLAARTCENLQQCECKYSTCIVTSSSLQSFLESIKIKFFLQSFHESPLYYQIVVFLWR